MRFPLWLFPIILVTILIPLINNNKEKSWDALTPEAKRKRIALLISGVVGLTILVLILFILN